MKLFFSTFFVLVHLLIFSGCKTTQQSASSYENEFAASDTKKYAVGKGGGFTGSYEEYIVYENGKVYKRDFNYEREIYLKQLSEIDLNRVLERINNLSLEGIEIDKPGNLTSYIEIREANYSINKIVWGANLYYPPEDLVNFHKFLFELLSKSE